MRAPRSCVRCSAKRAALAGSCLIDWVRALLERCRRNRLAAGILRQMFCRLAVRAGIQGRRVRMFALQTRQKIKRQFTKQERSSRAAPVGALRPSVETLESRLALATMNLPLDVTDVSVNEATGQLEAIVSLAGQAIDTVPLEVT